MNKKSVEVVDEGEVQPTHGHPSEGLLGWWGGAERGPELDSSESEKQFLTLPEFIFSVSFSDQFGQLCVDLY